MAATIKDIAQKTGLGLATVSSYLNGGNVREKNRIKIEAAIEELHFEVNEVARGLKTNRTKMIGIVIPELNNIFCAEIISEAEDILRSQGYAAMICDCRTDEKREAEAVDFLLHFAKASVPRLSIVTQPTRELAKHAAQLLLKRLEPGGMQGEKETVVLKTGFVAGNSVGVQRRKHEAVFIGD